jgi:dihydrofolate reductase
MTNKVFLATSLDGYIADKNHNLDFLQVVPNPDNVEMGFVDFMNSIDALLMGRKTFETVCSFDCDWPYDKPVFVLTNREIAPEYKQNAAGAFSGDIVSIIEQLNNNGYNNLYIDGGIAVQQALENDLVDEITIAKLPIILGEGIPLFSKMNNQLVFDHDSTQVFLDQIVQSKYIRKR